MNDIKSKMLKILKTHNIRVGIRVRDGGNLDMVNEQTLAEFQALGRNSVYSHTNSKGVTYYLHKTDVRLRGVGGKPGKLQTIYFFRKEIGGERQFTHAPYEPCALPADRIVRENPRNGFLTTGKYEPPKPEED